MAQAADRSSAPATGQELASLSHPPLQGLLTDLQQRFPHYSTATVILIDATLQRLLLIEQGNVTASWVISTAEAGLGSRKGSNQTPLGVHRVAKRFGDGAPLGTIFKARRNTGRIARILTEPGARSNEDNVTTRILWLDGLEPGLNKGGKVDSLERYIYIHGTDEEGRLGAPASHGCIRMRNRDVVDLYNRVGVDTLVVIARQRNG
ncbi:MAG: L,D-transpeptidase [Thiolinea sp.]